MTCFVLLTVSTGATAAVVRFLRREAILTVVAATALLLLAVFPTDLADLNTDAVTRDKPGRTEPCTLVGRIHNPLSTFVFLPVVLVASSLCVRARREPRWRGVAWLSVFCGASAICAIVLVGIHQQNTGWQGRRWTGLMQRSLVFPAIAWTMGLLIAAKNHNKREDRVL